MQLSDARNIVNTPKLQKQWALLTQDEADTLMNHVEERNDRQECCFPYDCMHHEECGSDDGNGGRWYCRSCKASAEAWEAVSKIEEKFPEAYQYAAALTRTHEADVVANQLQMVKDLEAVGDYAAAQRLFEGEGSW